MIDFVLIPWWQLLGLIAGFGVIIGSFLNVVIYRFRTGKSLSGSSHCLSCQTRLRWYDLFPLLSYLVLRGRCRACSAYIPSRYFVVELLTGCLFVLVVLIEPIWWLWPLMWTLISLLVVITVYDIMHLVIPHSLVIALGAIAGIHVAYQWLVVSDTMMLLQIIIAMAAAFAFFAGLWKVSAGRWIGFGDAKLVVPLAAMVGLSGTFSMIVLSFWIGTIISIGILVWQRVQQKRGQAPLQNKVGKLTMKSEVPFAPFLIAGFLLVYMVHIDVLALMSYVINSII
jgi:leader peptidase (prepilin peptidase) / N-methyltransferase